MANILPLYDQISKDKVIRECRAVLKFNNKTTLTLGQAIVINKLLGKLGILARNDRGLSKLVVFPHPKTSQKSQPNERYGSE